MKARHTKPAQKSQVHRPDLVLLVATIILVLFGLSISLQILGKTCSYFATCCPGFVVGCVYPWGGPEYLWSPTLDWCWTAFFHPTFGICQACLHYIFSCLFVEES